VSIRTPAEPEFEGWLDADVARENLRGPRHVSISREYSLHHGQTPEGLSTLHFIQEVRPRDRDICAGLHAVPCE
jgi:hypothetical protein